MRKIYLFKCFERAIIGNYRVATVEKTDDTYDFIITEVADLKTKKQFYYDNLTEMCVFKNNKNKSVIAVWEGEENIEKHKNDYI